MAGIVRFAVDIGVAAMMAIVFRQYTNAKAKVKILEEKVKILEEKLETLEEKLEQEVVQPEDEEEQPKQEAVQPEDEEEQPEDEEEQPEDEEEQPEDEEEQPKQEAVQPKQEAVQPEDEEEQPRRVTAAGRQPGTTRVSTKRENDYNRYCREQKQIIRAKYANEKIKPSAMAIRREIDSNWKNHQATLKASRPTRKLSPWQHFFISAMPRLKAQYPNIPQTERMKIAGIEWKSLQQTFQNTNN